MVKSAIKAPTIVGSCLWELWITTFAERIACYRICCEVKGQVSRVKGQGSRVKGFFLKKSMQLYILFTIRLLWIIRNSIFCVFMIHGLLAWGKGQWQNNMHHMFALQILLDFVSNLPANTRYQMMIPCRQDFIYHWIIPNSWSRDTKTIICIGRWGFNFGGSCKWSGGLCTSKTLALVQTATRPSIPTLA